MSYNGAVIAAGVLGGNTLCRCPPEVVYSLLVGMQLLHPSFQAGSCYLLPAISPPLQAGCALPSLVEQFHYQLWPDHGVPRNPAQLLCLVEMVNKRVLEAPAGPVLVHCSAGIGRTGTFIALDFLLKMGKAEGKVDVFQCVQRLREQRVSMVQTKVRSYLLPAHCQAAYLIPTLLRDVAYANPHWPCHSWSSHRDWSC
uniref:protein-tyrosine-phosphatase n=1 Tax=Athene cunicularia TaxID=194338 RepID=A0A663NAN5_ATHCN